MTADATSVADLVDAIRRGQLDLAVRGKTMHDRMEQLYPLCRSTSGEGLRETLRTIREWLPTLDEHAVPSGTAAHDWVVNDEWNIRDAYIADRHGRRVVDFRDHTLHVVGYSVPVRQVMSLEELRPHLHTLPDRPDWIPFRTTFHERTWGFCLAHAVLQELDGGPYEVVIDSTLEPGVLDYGELVVPGDSTDEVMVTTHTCHPSLANDNLSGIVVAAELAHALLDGPRPRLTYRFLFAPGTIGSITWLSRNADVLPRIRHGLVLTGLGGPGSLVWKRTRQGARPVDDAAAHVVARRRGDVRAYSPYGYDERQFNSLGFDLPFGRLSRTPHGEYPEYHTSGDDLAFVTGDQVADAWAALLEIVDVLENDATFRNLSPHGEPQLGRRGVYPTVGGRNATDSVMAMLWLLAYSDGRTSLLDVARTADLDFAGLREAAATLQSVGLLA